MTWKRRWRSTFALSALLSVAPVAAAADAGDIPGTISYGGLERRYELHVPPVLSGVPPQSTGAPLVIVLHGGGGQDDPVSLIRDVTRFNAKADAEGFIVLYPKAIEGYWNDGRGVPRYRSHARNVDDVGFISKLVDRVGQWMAIDRNRVYVAGASNGAMMAYRLACERPDRFATIAAVVGNLPQRLPCIPSQPVSVLIMNGTEDPLMPWEGGDVRFASQRLGQVLSTAQTVDKWVALNGCDRMPAIESLPNTAPLDGIHVTRSSYSRCSGGAEVQLYRMEGGGHTWPGGPQQTAPRVVGRVSRDVDATDAIWSFFATKRCSCGVPTSSGVGPFANPQRIQIR